MGSHLSSYFSDIDHEPELIDGKIIDSHTIEWNKSFQSNFPVIFNSWKSNNMLYIPLMFINNDENTNITIMKFLIPITELNIRESKKNDLTILTVTLKAKQTNTIFSKMIGNKCYENIVEYEIREKYTIVNDKEIIVGLVSGEHTYSSGHMMAAGLMVSGIGLAGLSLFSLYKSITPS